MIHQERSADIDATPEEIWAVLSRYMHVDEFSPGVVSVDALTSGEDGVGSKRRNHFENGSGMVEEVTKWVPNQLMQVKAIEFIKLPMWAMIADIKLKPVSPNRTDVTWSVGFQLKFGPIGWLMGQTVMKGAMAKAIDGNLQGLADQAAVNAGKIA